MDTLLNSIDSRKNAIVTSLGGAERSRFLLKMELIAISKRDAPSSFKRIFHIVTWDANVTEVYNRARSLPFSDFDFKIAKLYGSETEDNISDSLQVIQEAHILICPMKYLFNLEAGNKFNLSRNDSLVVFDGVPLDSIESCCCEILEPSLASDPGKTMSPSHVFKQMVSDTWCTILACNRPIDGLEHELGASFPIRVDEDLGQSCRTYRTFASIITEGPEKIPMLFGAGNKTDLLDEVGRIVELCASKINSGGIVVFLPSYGVMLAYHNHWKKSGLFERLGISCTRENRGDGQFKQLLFNLSKSKSKSLVLVTHRFHQNIQLADCTLSSSTRAIISVGLPYPFTNDAWNARMKLNDELASKEPGRLNGEDLYRYRAIEFMNGIIRKCLDEFRYQDCAFFILDKSAEKDSQKFTQELMDLRVENASQSIARFESFNKS